MGDVAWVLVGLDRVVGIDPRAQAVASAVVFGLAGMGWSLWNLRGEPAADAALDE